MRGSGESQQTLRSSSCIDISFTNSKNETESKNINQDGLLTGSTPNVAKESKKKPGVILARSIEALQNGIKNNTSQEGASTENDEKKKKLEIYSSLCEIPPSAKLSIEVHPFSGMLTSQLKCTDCKHKVGSISHLEN